MYFDVPFKFGKPSMSKGDSKKYTRVQTYSRHHRP
jgi:hypothetical protein